MENQAEQGTISSIRLPKRLFLSIFLVGELLPYLARLLGIPAHGWDWFLYYWAPPFGMLFIGVLTLIPVAVLYGLGKASKRAPTAFWFAAIAASGLLMWGHGTLNLRASSTAPIGLIFIPLYATVITVVAWVVGRIIHAQARSDGAKTALVRAVAAVVLIAAVGKVVIDTQTAAVQESRFPATPIQELPLDKRIVEECCDQGRVDVLRLGNFDADPAEEIAVLGDTGVTLLVPGTYAVKAKLPFGGKRCDPTCLGMNTDVVPDGNGVFFVTSSDGLADHSGNLIWELKSDSFRQLVPIRLSANGEIAFFAKHIFDRVERYDRTGKILWTKPLPAAEIAEFVTPEGERLLMIQVGRNSGPQTVRFYGPEGDLHKEITVPEWVMNAEMLAWPSRGHLLIGSGAYIGVVDYDGKLVLQHQIQNTSFRPYHGPDGTAVRLDPDQEPYLAVLSHGSSGYPRSVLLIFEPTGQLVWQEEFEKGHGILAVRRNDGKGEALLVGSINRVIEYRLNNLTLSHTNNGAQRLALRGL